LITKWVEVDPWMQTVAQGGPRTTNILCQKKYEYKKACSIINLFTYSSAKNNKDLQSLICSYIVKGEGGGMEWAVCTPKLKFLSTSYKGSLIDFFLLGKKDFIPHIIKAFLVNCAPSQIPGHAIAHLYL
jgi:hypothetical protein